MQFLYSKTSKILIIRRSWAVIVEGKNCLTLLCAVFIMYIQDSLRKTVFYKRARLKHLNSPTKEWTEATTGFKNPT